MKHRAFVTLFALLFSIGSGIAVTKPGKTANVRNVASNTNDCVSPTEPPPTCHYLRCKAITLSATKSYSTVTASCSITVKDEDSDTVPSATVHVTWNVPGGAVRTATAATNGSGIATFSTSGATGTYKVTVTNIVKTGSAFDASNSISPLYKTVSKY